MILGQTVCETLEELISCRTNEQDKAYHKSAKRLKGVLPKNQFNIQAILSKYSAIIKYGILMKYLKTDVMHSALFVLVQKVLYGTIVAKWKQELNR